MKKLFIFFVCAVLLCCLLCSCGSKSGGELTEPTQGQSVTEESVTVTGAEKESTTAEPGTTAKKAEPATAEKTTAVTEKAKATTAPVKETATAKAQPTTVPGTTTAPAKETTTAAGGTEKAESDSPSAKELKVKYIRDNSGDYDAPTKAMIISSADVLKALYRDSTGELAKLCEEYTEEYFKTGVLLVAVTVESSGSISHKVTGVDNNNGKLCVNIKTETPEVGTCDMAVWQIVVEYPAGNYSKITVNKK